MKFKFPSPETAEGFACGLGAPDELDVVAWAVGDTVEVLGLNDHLAMVAALTEMAINAGGVAEYDN